MMQIAVKYNLNLANDGYWRLQAWVSECGDDDDPNVFVHQLLPVLSNKPDESNVIFVDIANRADMEEYPIDTPADKLSFFRKRHMDVSLQDSSEMQGAIRRIENDLRLLTNTYEDVV